MAKCPNILFFFTDQQRWDTCGCYGQPMDVTPNLDQLAAEGVRFESAFTCQPVCGPARACLQTGLWATQVGTFTNGIPLPLEAKTIAHHLGDAGYQTGYVGKWHLASRQQGREYWDAPVPPQRRGGYRDFWHAADVLEFTSHSYDGHMWDTAGNRVDFPQGRYRVDHQTDLALEFLQNRDPDRPFFLMLSYLEPHHQNDNDRYEGPAGSKKRFADCTIPPDLAAAGDLGDWQENYPDYLGCCASLDENLGRIRKFLADQGILDETLIIYTSDHGSHFRTRNSEYKRSCHDACLRVPMVLRGPGYRGGKVIEELVSLLDLPPAILASAGLEAPVSFAGRDLQPLAEGKAEDWPEDVFAQISEDHIGRTLRTKRWKYEVWVPGSGGASRPGSQEYTEARLYDLQTDPHELNNRVCDPDLAAVRGQLAKRLVERMTQAGEAPAIIHPAEVPAPDDGRFERKG
ncbi:MAG: sulfatase-like hydrolase/transferase [Phycisphaerae bacterium]